MSKLKFAATVAAANAEQAARDSTITALCELSTSYSATIDVMSINIQAMKRLLSLLIAAKFKGFELNEHELVDWATADANEKVAVGRTRDDAANFTSTIGSL